LLAQLAVSAFKDRDQRLGLKLFGHGSHVVEPLRLAKHPDKTIALHSRPPQKSPLGKMMAQEARLNSRRMTRTVLATGPLFSIRPEISPPMTAASKEGNTFMRRNRLYFRYWHYKHLGGMSLLRDEVPVERQLSAVSSQLGERPHSLQCHNERPSQGRSILGHLLVAWLGTAILTAPIAKAYHPASVAGVLWRELILSVFGGG